MPLFQEAIIKKHLSAIDQTLIDSAYSEYKRVYSPEKIKNIKVAKEEQYQEGFIKDVFGAVLGYSVYPESPFNIETERRNETNAKKADGAILKDEKVVGVIELKDNKTKNLDSVKDQAFGYKNNHKECSYVISSNFHKLRFYIDDATEYEEFDLYNLDKETFKRFYLYLRKEGLLDKNLPKLLRQETKFHEEEISKKLYKDYTGFKQSFFENAVKNNAQYDKLLLFKKSQKFLDRILFLLFAEDKGLVGTNSIVKIVEKWSGADDDYYRPLYEMVNTYFGHLYRGYTYQKTGEVIPQFGGELFAPDEVLDVLTIDDAVLKNDLLVLSKYDFNTDVDVNILGHIFEHSLNEVDDVEASLRGETPDKTKSKRKKDGVFYTPKYITKYIVDNTLGKLCAEKKAEWKLDGDIAIFEYQKADGKLNEKGKDLYERLNAYKAWLLTVKVCDPACGSGAFLNQALSFFIDEHRFIDDLVAELTNTPLRLFDTDLQILENNIYGVDINEESVEIAKLSLWLRTAQPGRKLSDLSANIKCGNSLIDDPAVAGDKAFNWQQEFPAVFERASTEHGPSGGFDVVIGNPPYVRQELFKEIKPFLQENYKCYNSVADLYTYFIEKGISLIKNSGLFSYILPNKFLKATYGREIRNVIMDNASFDVLFDFDDYPVFDDATTYPIIFILNKKNTNQFLYSSISKNDKCQDPISLLIRNAFKISSSYLDAIKEWSFMSSQKLTLMDKISNCSVSLGELTKNRVYLGIKTGKNEAFVIDENVKSEIINADPRSFDLIKKVATGKEVYRYKLIDSDKFLLFTKHDLNIEENYPSIFKWLSTFKDDLIKRGDKGKAWWNLRPCDYYDEIQKPKIIWRSISSECGFYLDESGELLLTNNNYFIASGSAALAGVLNSKVSFFILSSICTSLQGGYFDFRRDKVLTLPIPRNYDKVGLEFLVLDIQKTTKSLQSVCDRLGLYIQSKFPILRLTSRLIAWHDLTFPDFIKELNKAIKASKGTLLTKKDEFEWMELFEENKKKVLELKAEIDKTDHEIDRMVYALYGLTEEEIRIVESA
jgi:hypothetical protein